MTDRLVQYTQTRLQHVSSLNSNVTMLDKKDADLVQYALNKEWTNPKYKLDNFVGNQQITPFAKLRQWLLEIKTREENLESMEYEHAKYEIELARKQAMVDGATNEYDRALAEIELKSSISAHIKAKRRLNDWYLERQNLVDLVNDFMKTPDAVLPDGTGRTYFDILNTAEEDKYEAEYWTNRLGKQAACDLMFYGRINTGNLDAILSMPAEQQMETLTLAINYATRLQSIQNGIQEEVNKNLGVPPESGFGTSSLSLPKTPTEVPTNTPDKKSKNGDDLDVYSA